MINRIRPTGVICIHNLLSTQAKLRLGHHSIDPPILPGQNLHLEWFIPCTPNLLLPTSVLGVVGFLKCNNMVCPMVTGMDRDMWKVKKRKRAWKGSLGVLKLDGWLDVLTLDSALRREEGKIVF
jgi:hypothetical protein